MKDAAETRREAERELQEMLAFDHKEQPLPEEAPKVLGAKGAKHIVCMVFKSSSEGIPHVVSRRDNYDGSVEVLCTCEARPGTCWAVSEFRQVAGLQVERS